MRVNQHDPHWHGSINKYRNLISNAFNTSTNLQSFNQLKMLLKPHSQELYLKNYELIQHILLEVSHLSANDLHSLEKSKLHSYYLKVVFPLYYRHPSRLSIYHFLLWVTVYIFSLCLMIITCFIV